MTHVLLFIGGTYPASGFVLGNSNLKNMVSLKYVAIIMMGLRVCQKRG